MGYSLSVSARSVVDRDRMLSFMEKEYRPHWKIRGLKEWPCYSSPPLRDPCYSPHGSTILGIEFNASGFERGYAMTLTRWMALKVGRPRRVFKSLRLSFKTPVPYMFYDEEPWPVLNQSPKTQPKELREWCVDAYAMKRERTCYDDFVFDIDDKSFEAFWHGKAHAETRKRHDDPMALRDDCMRLLWPQIKVVVQPLREEMRRLEAAWAQWP